MDPSSTPDLDVVPQSSTTALYGVRGTTVFKHPMIGRRLRSTSCHALRFRTCTLPHDTTRTTIAPTETQAYTQGTAPDRSSQTTNPIVGDIWTTAPHWIPKGLMRDCKLPRHWESIVKSVWDGTCIAVTDGSFYSNVGYIR